GVDRVQDRLPVQPRRREGGARGRRRRVPRVHRFLLLIFMRFLHYFVTLALLPVLAPGCRVADVAEPADSTTVYLTEAEALKVVFPDAARVVEEDVALSPEERRSIEQR